MIADIDIAHKIYTKNIFLIKISTAHATHYINLKNAKYNVHIIYLYMNTYFYNDSLKKLL